MYARATVAALLAMGPSAHAASPDSPAAEQRQFQQYFQAKFPGVPLDEFANGAYAIDPSMRKQWEDILQMPPYDFAIDEGKRLFEHPFADGKTYAQCLPGGGVGTRQSYPRFDPASGTVITLPIALNGCRTASGEPALDLESGPMAALTAYLASTSRGKPFAVTIPDDPRALAAFADGRAAFDDPRGTATTSCASCHVAGAGVRPDGGSIAPALGILASFPIYRSGWGEMGTVARRIRSCDAGIGNTPLAADAPTYRNVEFYLSFMSNGVAIAGPGARP